MGGTTAKVGLIQDGRPSVTKDYNVGGHAGAGIGGMSLSGYPVRTPVVDLVEIGAGGGSIAWVDSGGLLRVGPRSAGADPGPVCYRRGGVEPTVTDANVVLGRLNPRYFLGGEIGLDVEGAARAIEERCAKPLRDRRHRGRERHRRDRERRDGERAPPDLRAAGLTARLRPRRLRRRGPYANALRATRRCRHG
jgi:N-methylhydantoinase A